MPVETTRTQISNHLIVSTQDDAGRDIDVLIGEIAKTNFDRLAKENHKDTLDSKNITKINFGFTVASIVLSVITVICALATIIFSTGIVTAGAQTLAAVTGFVGITAAFTQLDQAISRYIKYRSQRKTEMNRIAKLQNKVDDIKGLISNRITLLTKVEDEKIKDKYCGEILAQIVKVNEFVRHVKEKLPSKITQFKVFDVSQLLALVK